MVNTCNAATCHIISSFRKKFACNVELKSFEWKVLLDHLVGLVNQTECEEHQRLLLEKTIKSETFVKYPIKQSYQKAFLKELLRQTSEYQIPYECLFEVYTGVLAKTEDNQEYCFKHYLYGDHNIIIKENINFISGGTTGLCSWEGGKALANWCLNHRRLFKNKNVVELGSGSGLSGLGIINSLSPKKYIFTDCHPLVLERLRDNLNINIEGEQWPRLKGTTVVDVVELNWEEASDSDFENLNDADIVLGADIVYDLDLIPPLCSILSRLISDYGKCAIIACSVRNQETVDTFIATIESVGFIIKQNTSMSPIVFEVTCTTPVNIYVINK